MRTIAQTLLQPWSAGPAVLAAALVSAPAMGTTTASPFGDTVAIHAGTIHQVEGGTTISDGVVVTQDGKIIAVGAKGSVEVPAGATTVDYGPDAVLVPGLVAVDSAYASSQAGPRTADPTLLAIDQFDPYSNIVSALRSGITTVYLAPARGRLIAGQGAVVKTGGGELGSAEGRVLRETAGLHGSISDEARATQGYWTPPVPATVDVGLGLEREQLPRTTMGAVLAFEELMAFAGGDDAFAIDYGRSTGPALAKALKANMTWRIGGETTGEVRALLDIAKRYNLPIVIDGASRAASVAEEISEAGIPVIARPHYRSAGNFGKNQTSDWPTYDTISRLVGEGVTVAIAAPDRLGTADLRFAAALSMRGGLSEADALQAITLNAAKILGVDDRVGSITVGKDADLAVFSGSPMSVGSTVLATMIGGDLAWSPEMAASARAKARAKKDAKSGRNRAASMPANVVISVDELHVGNGVVHSPGEILVRNGKIAQVAARVGRPAGAPVVRGAAAMPGMIDAYGHLGIEGGRRPFTTRFDTKRILEPGDYADRKVAKGGVTTVNLISRNLSGVTPSIAYKPAATSFDSLVVDDVASVRMQWDSSIITQSGGSVKDVLAKAKKYAAAWEKYEADIAKWTPPAEEPAEASDDDEESDEDEDKDEKKKDDKKGKKGKKERDPAKPVTGVFEGTAVMDGMEEPASVRYQFLEAADGTITGSARVSIYDDLLVLTGKRDGYDVTLTVETPDGDIDVTLAQIYSNDPKPKEKKSKKKDDDKKSDKDAKDDKKDEDKDAEVKTFLRGEAKSGDTVVATIDVTQVSGEFKTAKRPVRLPVTQEKAKEPKGKPKKPSIDPDLEPIRRAMMGEAAVLVTVNRDDQILACVAAFEAAGIKPVLFDSNDVHKVADQIAGRVSGVLLPQGKMFVSNGDGTTTNRMVTLTSAGIPVAFLSQAEEGAVELSVIAARAVARGLAPSAALRGLTADAAAILAIDDRVGTLEAGKDADIVVLDGSPLEVSSSVKRVFVNGREVH